MDVVQKRGWSLDIGANPIGMDSAQFRVWAPYAKSVAVRLIDQDMVTVPMQPDGRGYFDVTVKDIGSRARYRYVLDGVKERPDPASRFQPEGVHGPSVVVDPDAFQWTDQAWRGLPLEEFIIYELHVGTFTEEGTFEAIIRHLSYLKEAVG
ncbi:MAG: hypothetical protein OEY28_06765, partial [Nitrospira sp.]|nr:hypothetical protein [Nitrospira sp.]